MSKPVANTILITGMGGSIGSELARQLAPDNVVYGIDNNETNLFSVLEELKQKGYKVYGKVGDIRDGKVLEDLISEVGYPNLIFHAAALKHVTPSGWNPDEYTGVNIIGTLNVLRFAKHCKATLINISTDKVVQSNSIMGATKRVAEIAVRDAKQISVRFGNVLGSRGSVIEIWQRQMDNNEPLTVTDEKMTRFMMSIQEAVELVIQATKLANPGDIMIMDMGEKVNILDLAHKILNKANKSLDVKIIGTRPGEMITETLMSPDEEARAIRLDKFWVIKYDK